MDLELVYGSLTSINGGKKHRNKGEREEDI